MRIFLIHGMGRSRASLLLLASRLKRAGHQPSLFGYSVARHPINTIADRFLAHINKVLEHDEKVLEHDEDRATVEYGIVGHSLGNIVTRYATDALPAGLCRFAMLAPPNRSPLLAKKLQHNPVFRVLTQDAGQRLADEKFYESLDRPRVPTVIFAGNKGPKRSWLPFEDKASDGVVSVDETRLEGVEHFTLPVLHTFIMNHPRLAKELNHFLHEGALEGKNV